MIILLLPERVTHLTEEYNLPLKLVYNVSKGFHIVMSSKNMNEADLPAIFTQVIIIIPTTATVLVMVVVVIVVSLVSE